MSIPPSSIREIWRPREKMPELDVRNFTPYSIGGVTEYPSIGEDEIYERVIPIRR